MKTEQENYPKCRTCRHFSEGLQFVAPFGYCEKIQDDDRTAEQAYVTGVHEEASIFHPHPDKFGCILHESVTTDSQ